MGISRLAVWLNIIIFPGSVFSDDFSFVLPSGIMIQFETPDGVSLEVALANPNITISVTLRFNSPSNELLYRNQGDGGLNYALNEFRRSKRRGSTINVYPHLCDTGSGTITHVLLSGYTPDAVNSVESGSATASNIGQAIKVNCFFEGCTMQFHPISRSDHCKKYHGKTYLAYKAKAESPGGLECPICKLPFFSFHGFFIHFGKVHKNETLRHEL